VTTQTDELTQLQRLDAFLESEEIDLDDLRQEINQARLRVGLPPALSVDADPDLTTDPREDVRFFIQDLMDEHGPADSEWADDPRDGANR
jgi:hypothetical protein